MKSIKMRLVVAFTSVVLVVTLCLGAISVFIINDKLIEAAYDDLQALAEAEAKYVQSVNQIQLNYLMGLVKSPFILDEAISMEEKTTYLEQEAERMGYKTFGLTDKDGLGHLLNANRDIVNVASEPFFLQAINGDVAVSDVLINEITAEAEMAFAVPLTKDGAITGVFYAVCEAIMISDIVNQTKYRETGYAYILNNEGATVAHENYNNVLTRDNTIENAKDNPALRELADLTENVILRGKPGYARYLYSGSERLVGFAPLKEHLGP